MDEGEQEISFKYIQLQLNPGPYQWPMQKGVPGLHLGRRQVGRPGGIKTPGSHQVEAARVNQRQLDSLQQKWQEGVEERGEWGGADGEPRGGWG